MQLVNLLYIPKNKFDYCENFVNMMFDLPAYDYVPDPVVVKALILIDFTC